MELGAPGVNELRRTAAAALGLLEVGDVDAARDVLRAFLRTTR